MTHFFGIGLSTVLAIEGIVMRTSRNTTVGKIRFFVNMESVFAGFAASFQIPGDFTTIFGFLEEGDNAAAFVVAFGTTVTGFAVWPDGAGGGDGVAGRHDY